MRNSGWTKKAATTDLPCGWRLRNFSLLYDYFAFLDVKEHYADSLFAAHKISVKYLHEFEHRDTKYRIIFCKCRRRDSESFCAALEELPNKMLICGHPDYIDFCEKAKLYAEKGLKEFRQKEA